MKKTILVIDCVYDFINGSLACQHSEEAVQNIIKYINAHQEDQVIYVREVHPANHCSFSEQGGMWPAHAVEGTRGCELHADFLCKIEDTQQRPNDKNVFIKGKNPEVEEYSGYEGKNSYGECLVKNLSKEIVIAGIATEYCVLNTLNDLVANGFRITLLEEGLGCVEEEGHKKTIQDLKVRKINII
ncbi:MAG: isochorismatase family protein [Cellulosilyticaceae bacterium]